MERKITTADYENAIIGLMPWLRIKAWCFTKNNEEADDLTQETILDALEKKDIFRGDCSVKSWVYRLMRNLFINKCVADSRHIIEHYERFPEDTRTYEPTIDAKDELEKILGYARQCVSIECLVMFAMGYSQKEIAEAKNISTRSIGTRLCDARERFLPRIKSETKVVLRPKKKKRGRRKRTEIDSLFSLVG